MEKERAYRKHNKEKGKYRVRKAQRPRQKKDNPEVMEKARQLAEEWGIAMNAAVQIAKGQRDLNEYLVWITRKRSIHKLMEEHEINGGLAALVVDQKVSLERALFLDRWGRYRARNNMRTFISENMQKKREAIYELFEGERLRGRVIEDNPYEFVVETNEGEEREVHKLLLKYAYLPEHADEVQKALSIDEKIAAKNLRPAEKILDRNRIHNHTLFELYEEKQVLYVTLLEGEKLKGIISWFSQWDIEILMKGGTPTVFYRHAIYDFRTKAGKSMLRK